MRFEHIMLIIIEIFYLSMNFTIHAYIHTYTYIKNTLIGVYMYVP